MKFLGTIEYIDFDSLKKLLREIFPNEIVKSKVRVIGEEVNINSERIDIYVHNQHHDSQFYYKNKGSYIVQGEIKSELLSSLKIFAKILSEIQQSGFHYNFDIYPDKEDESFEMYFRSIKYEIFMNEMKQKITEANNR